LIRNKRAAGRPKDLADVAALEALRHTASAKRRPHKGTAPHTKSGVKHSAALEKPRTKRRPKK
jgi:hypothetical protein